MLTVDKYIKQRNLNKSDVYFDIMAVINTLNIETDYFIDKNNMYLTDSGIEKIDTALMNKLDIKYDKTDKKSKNDFLYTYSILGVERVKLIDISKYLDIVRESLYRDLYYKTKTDIFTLYASNTSVMFIKKDDIPLYTFRSRFKQAKKLKDIEYVHNNDALNVINCIDYKDDIFYIYEKDGIHYISLSDFTKYTVKYANKYFYTKEIKEYMLQDTQLFNAPRMFVSVNNLDTLAEYLINSGSNKIKECADDIDQFVQYVKSLYVNENNISNCNDKIIEAKQELLSAFEKFIDALIFNQEVLYGTRYNK